MSYEEEVCMAMYAVTHQNSLCYINFGLNQNSLCYIDHEEIQRQRYGIVQTDVEDMLNRRNKNAIADSYSLCSLNAREYGSIKKIIDVIDNVNDFIKEKEIVLTIDNLRQQAKNYINNCDIEKAFVCLSEIIDLHIDFLFNRYKGD